MRLLIHHEPMLGERLEVYALNDIGQRLYQLQLGNFMLATPEIIKITLEKAAEIITDHGFSQKFCGMNGIRCRCLAVANWEAYRDVRRLGRKTRLPETHRKNYGLFLMKLEIAWLSRS